MRDGPHQMRHISVCHSVIVITDVCNAGYTRSGKPVRYEYWEVYRSVWVHEGHTVDLRTRACAGVLDRFT